MNTKPTLILSALLLSAGSLMAQSIGSQHSHTPKVIQKLRSVMPAATAAKTTTQQERVVAKAFYYESATVPYQRTDSSAYSYPNNDMGSHFNFIDLNYPDYYNFNDMTGGYVNYDTVYHYTDVIPPDKDTRTYTGSGNIASQASANFMTFYTYNGQDKLVMTEQFQYDPIAMEWDTANRTYYFYDVNGLLVQDSMVENYTTWYPVFKTDYRYNALGMPDTIYTSSWISGTWVTEMMGVATYTSAALPKAMISYGLMSGNWIPEFKDTMGYTGNQMTYRVNEIWMMNVWDLYSQEIRNLNSAGVPDSIFRQQYSHFAGSWDTTITKLTYNSYDNPVKMIQTYSHGAEKTSNFYYELHGTTGIPQAPKVKELAIYPNPANDQLHIKPGQLSSGKLQMNIINALGQTVYRAAVSANQAATIPVHHLQSGTYWLSMQDGDSYYRASFIKN